MSVNLTIPYKGGELREHIPILGQTNYTGDWYPVAASLKLEFVARFGDGIGIGHNSSSEEGLSLLNQLTEELKMLLKH